MQINKDNIRENRKRADHDYKVGDKIMLTKHTVYTYKTPYTGPFVITQRFSNDTVNLQCGAVQINYNIRRIKPHKTDTKVEDISSKNKFEDVNISASSYRPASVYQCNAHGRAVVFHTLYISQRDTRLCPLISQIG